MSMRGCGYDLIHKDDVATLSVVADKLDAMSKDMAKCGVMNVSLSLKAQAMTIKSIVEGMRV